MKGVDKKQFTVEFTSSGFGMHRDAYYKYCKRKTKSDKVEEQVINIVQRERKTLAREGCTRQTI